MTSTQALLTIDWPRFTMRGFPHRALVLGLMMLSLAFHTACGGGGGGGGGGDTSPQSTAPAITTPPASQTVSAGQGVTFTVVATGTVPLHYHWKKNNIDLGPDSSNFDIVSAQTGDAGSYTVTVSNSVGRSQPSQAAILTVNPVVPAPVVPTLTRFTPPSGPVGTGVTLTGTDLSGATAVEFNGKAATFHVASATQVTATVPAGASTGTIAVTTLGGTATSSASFTVTASVPPILTGFTPPSGPVGTRVTLTGTNLTGATAVKFNGTVATTFTVTSATQATATVPAGATTGTLAVTTPGGTATSSASFTVTPPVATTHWVSGYYVAYQQSQLAPEDIDWTGLTHIMMGRIQAKADGTVDQSFDIGAPAGPALARQISTRAHQNGVKAILMLGGDGNGAAILGAVRDHRAAFIVNLKQAMSDYDYDGLDLDWEDHVDWDLFKIFAQELRAAVGDKILTMPGGAINPNYQSVDPKVVAVTPYLDQFNLMSYYPSTAAAGGGWLSWHNSPLSGQKSSTPVTIEDSLNRYFVAGVPKAKLGMGISFYAIGYSGNVTGPNQSTESGVSIRGGDNVYPLSSLFGGMNAFRGALGAFSEASMKWDDQAQCSYLSISQPDFLFGCRYHSFEDERSILAKGQFARDNGYGGIIIWTINQGYVGAHSNPNFLMQALRKGFIDPSATQVVAVSVSPANNVVGKNKTKQFRALVTGTTNKGVQWTIQEGAAGGSINGGLYTAPATAGTYHVVATTADSGKVATAKVVVAEDASWNPGLTLHGFAEWWKSVSATDSHISQVVFESNGARVIMDGGATNFTTLMETKPGAKVRLYAFADDGRTAKTVEIVWPPSDPYTCPIEGIID